jgi:hypothetical protein
MEQPNIGNKLPIPDYADANVGRLVTIANFRDEADAHMAASKLGSEGIESIITDVVRIAGAKRRATLRVLADDVESAISILARTPARAFLIQRS